MRLLGRFLKDRWKLLCFFAGCAAIFAAVFFLYRLSLEPVLYAALLCMALGLLVLAIQFVRFCHRHKQRQRIFRQPDLLYREMPEPQTLEEEDDNAILQAFGEQYQKLLGDWQAQKSDSMDYYGAWVHQIKTPIAVMKMLLQHEDTPESRMLSDELFRIEQYAEMALTYLRLDGSASDLVFRRCRLDEILRSVIRKFAPQFINRRIRLEYTPTMLEVLTDEKWLTFLLEQLLSNAVKYTKHGTVTISVTPEKVVRIADTGIGIAPEDLPRIFEKGFTGYNGRAGQKSTGLGLYLCKRAAQKISARITASSVVGEGSVFSVDLNLPELQVE
ncbi:sensor histidine kinase [Ruminococcus sp.]|uniref:sensor histidine kinase n=1 Tax=Ruminococcus sp. TaxID=41978 RepID=UPI002E76E662|nr:HAMP domain-containing sensor histidine kinase [Ruminococcus sp.]MEE1397185.1 HAMP domain-containing sensor histidine kinase [Ruminococcus sp.]